MEEILDVCKFRPKAFWLILECGHWYKWTGAYKPPKVGSEISCSNCAAIPIVWPKP
jgi:hypothetical protein